MSRQISVRLANQYDIFQIEALLGECAPEMDFPLPPHDPHLALQKLLAFISSGAVIVAECEKQVVGVLILEAVQFWWADRPHYIQTVEFSVHKEYRKGGTAAHLLKKAKEAADQTQVPLLIIVTSGTLAEQKDKFIERCGFRYQGGNLLYKPTPKSV